MAIDPLGPLRDMLRALIREELAKLQTPDLLTTAEAAAFAKLTPETLREWIAAGKLKAARAGRSYRIRRADLEAALSAPRRARAVIDISPESAARRKFG
jgi:excisionase family DNA binding protein